MADTVALQGFIDKWLVREPEMAICEVFCPAQQRELFRAWGGLSAELAECMFEIEDANVARTKLVWWADDLAAGAGGRHPLTRALFGNEAATRTRPEHWRTLVTAAIQLVDSDHAPATLSAALDELMPVADAISKIEAALFQVGSEPSAQALHLQIERNMRGVLGNRPERSRIPADARDSNGAVDMRRYAAALNAAAASPQRGSLLIVFRGLVDRERSGRWKKHGDPARALPLSAWRSLYLAWRSARLSMHSRVQAAPRD